MLVHNYVVKSAVSPDAHFHRNIIINRFFVDNKIQEAIFTLLYVIKVLKKVYSRNDIIILIVFSN